jgi:1-acyl-sn-glycerol-3-phosphate acyltransferase
MSEVIAARNSQKDDNNYWKRYKSYPVSHFSRWRIFLQGIVRECFVTPYFALFHKPRVYGRSNIPREGPFIVASNHISMLDPPLLSMVMGYHIAFMAKKELFSTRLKAEFYRSQGCFALDRDNPDSATVKTAFNALKSPNKWALGMFPEGTRSTNGKVLPFKKGIGALAAKTKVPVLPVGICRDADDKLMVTIGELITDVSDAEALQEKLYHTISHLADPSWERKY